MNAYDQKMQMKRENIADRGIWTAKKRYILTYGIVRVCVMPNLSSR